MAHTTLNDYIDYAGADYDPSLATKITQTIPVAERMLERRVGVDFYGVSAQATEDWIYATCVIVDYLLVYGDKNAAADRAGPYKSERLGDYAFTLRDDMWTPYQDFRIRDILAEYSTHGPLPNILFITAVGPANPYRSETTEL